MEVRIQPGSHSLYNIDLYFRFHRGITRPFFSKDRISDFEIFEEHTAKALEALDKRLAKGGAVDFQVCVNFTAR